MQIEFETAYFHIYSNEHFNYCQFSFSTFHCQRTISNFTGNYQLGYLKINKYLFEYPFSESVEQKKCQSNDDTNCNERHGKKTYHRQ